MSTTDEIKSQFETYLEENEKFAEKGVKASATRARKALQELGKLIKTRRKEILEEKAAASSKQMDLHGLTLDEAYNRVKDAFADCYSKGIRKLKVITGRSGEICRQFPHWAELDTHVKSCKLNRDGGSYFVRIKHNGRQTVSIFKGD